MIVKWFLALFLLMLFNYGIQAQVAPGVPPQRYVSEFNIFWF